MYSFVVLNLKFNQTSWAVYCHCADSTIDLSGHSTPPSSSDYLFNSTLHALTMNKF